LDDILDDISEKGWLIVSCFYTSDTNQVCLICKGEESETEAMIKELKQVSKE